ncbi:MAG TPA: LamG-like jellyroll fold domain-containing protein [Puia sp.]|nr:LamG-like jellyroll fold domain-containing protein [Puia sp.]
MKSITSKLKLLTFAGIAFAAAMVIQSCSKSKSTSSTKPTVTSVTTGSNDTAGTTTIVTITGKNLSGASVTTTTNNVTISNVSASSTSITLTVKIGGGVPSGSVTLDITTSAGSTTAQITIVGLTPLGGFISSDSVEPAALIAYWPLNGNVNDTVGNQTGTAVGATFIQGIRGQAYQGAAGAYATVPANSSFKNVQSYSVSLWYNLPMAVRPTSGGTAAGMFFLSGDTTGSSGNYMILEADIASASQLAADSVPIHNGFDNLGTTGPWANFTMSSYDTATSNWVHVVMTYDGGSSTYTFYENGQPIAVQSAYGTATSTTLYDGPLPVGSGTPPTALMGNLNFSTVPDPPTTVYIGAWPPGLYGVSATLGASGDFQGALDEIRVYNIAIKATDVVGLYLNGLAGR